ncbi:type II secretion system secretin GspD [Bdellovibrionota bacterium FG-1]
MSTTSTKSDYAILLGALAWAVLTVQIAQAADAGKGFQPGPRTFTNPFANTPPGSPPPPPGSGNGSFYEDDEEDEPDFPGNQLPTDPGSPPPSSNAASSSRTAAASHPTSGISGGGTTAGGVIQHNPPASIHIDDETGEGSKEIVTDFNYPDADIMDIAKTLGKLTGKNFIIDKDVKGRITIISNGPITVGDAWKAFLTALDMNSFALIPSGKYIRIARQRDARDKQLRTYTGDSSPDTDALITRVFPLKYINAEEVARTFRSFMPANSRIIPYEQTNTVIVTDTGSNIAKLNKMLELLDVEGYDAGIEVIPVKFASATDLSKLIDQLIPGTGAPHSPGAPRMGGMGVGRFSSRRTKEGGIINTIISDDRTNTLIVHANTRGADQVRELVAKLDQRQPINSDKNGRVHVVYLQFADAEQIGNTLNNFSQQPPGGGFKPISPMGGGLSTGINPVGTSLFEGSIKVSPDKATNSLVITASPTDYETVQRVIYRLDIPRNQVFVEAIVMEVSVDRGTSFSASVASPVSGLGFVPNGDFASFIQNPLAATGAILGFKGGGTVNVPGPGGTQIATSSVQGLIKAIQSTTKTNVLATPQIIALDNTDALFESKDRIPIPVTTAVQGAGTSTSVQKEDVILSIKIKPQINKISDFVKLEAEVKLGDVTSKNVAQVAGFNVPSTLERTAKTTVVIGDGDTLVIGGLIRDKVSELQSKIPLLGDIPVLGWLFRSQDSRIEKTNLLVFLTPHIVRPYEKVRAILDQKLKERDDFLEKNFGGEDPLRDTRDKIIRSLPDIKALSAQKPTASVSLDEENAPPAAVEVTPETSNPAQPAGGNTAPIMPPAPPMTGAGG